jgi:rhomboid family GlyGly-CTERM serine protease
MSDALPRAKDAMLPRKAWWFLGLAIAVLVLLWLGGDGVRASLRYEREGVLHRQYWRLVTGHLVHGSCLHLALNAAGLALVALLFPYDYPPWRWVIVALSSVAAIDIGFVFWEPQLPWYVGLSGVLHGALAAGAIALWRHESRGLAFAVTVIFVAKLTWEQVVGALPLSGDMPVIVDAHLYGAMGGAVAGIGFWLADRRWLPRHSSL